MKVISIFLIIIMVSVMVLSGCEERNPPFSKEEKRFLGTWKGPTIHVLAFFPDRACSYHSDFSGYWQVKDGKLIIDTNTATVIFSYNFSENDSILTISEKESGYIADYIRQ